MKLTSNSPSETYELGFTLGKYCTGGSVLCIEGEMGAGKTALSQGIIRGLGVVDQYITSPTYTLVNEYNVDKLTIYHFDIYRVGDYDELLGIGFEEYLREDSVVIIEWADIIGEYLPKEKIWITISRAIGDELRTITIEGLENIELELVQEELRKWEKNENIGH